jgi:L-seryl-tRNA(Ser) seleniumtransferase
MTVAALDAVLREHQSGRGAEIPILRMLALSADEIRRRAAALRDRLAAEAGALVLDVAHGVSAVGGGAAPTVEIPTALLCVRHPRRRPDEMARALRAGHPPILARVAEDALIVDLRTVDPAEEDAVRSALAGLAG